MYVDQQIHFHIIPRYKEEIEFGGIKWIDDNQADPLLQKRELVEQNVLNQIKNYLFQPLKGR